MRRCIPLYLALVLLSACRGDDATRPQLTDASSPTNSISDGNHCAVPGFGCAKGNPDFFFLPPMAANPSGTPNWTPGAFNGALSPVVDICELSATTEQQVRDGAECASSAGAYSVALALGPANVSDEQYQVNWGVPSSSAVFYRIAVRVGGTKLGWSDVETAANASKLKNVTTGEFVPLVDGRTLPIKFRIERYALCQVPGTGPCTSQSIGDLAGLTAPVTVSTSLEPDAPPSGVIFEPSPTPPSTAPVPHTVTVESCQGLRERGILDLPTFGPCVRVTITPALTEPLPTPAIVFSCEVTEQAVIPTVADPAQAERIALHMVTGIGSGQKIRALSHEHPACGPTTASADGSLRGLFAALAHGRLRAAAREMAALLSPTPAYAARRFIDLGGGGGTHFVDDAVALGYSAPRGGRPVGVAGRTQDVAPAPESFSTGDFQFALPARFQVDATPDQAGAPGSSFAVQVKVVDLGGAPVRDARVRFAADGGASVDPAIVEQTGADGAAHLTWTLGATDGVYHLTATGRGIAGADVNGPRPGVDPFQPLQIHWGDESDSKAPALVGTGSMIVGATTLGSINGTVVNAFDGSAIGGATVTAGAYTTTSGPSGSFQIAGVPSGSYDVTATATDYVSATTGGIVVTPGAGSSAGELRLAPAAKGTDIRIVLDWKGCSYSNPPDTGPCDLDSHLTGPDANAGRFHVYYGDPSFSDAASAATLDVDHTDGRGPETITLSRELSGGSYHYYVHDFSEYGNYNDPVPLSQSGARVRVYSGATLLATFDVPTSGSGQVWDVFTLVGSTVTPVNTLASFDPFTQGAAAPGRAVAGAAGTSSLSELQRIRDDIVRTPKQPR